MSVSGTMQRLQQQFILVIAAFSLLTTASGQQTSVAHNFDSILQDGRNLKEKFQQLQLTMDELKSLFQAHSNILKSCSEASIRQELCDLEEHGQAIDVHLLKIRRKLQSLMAANDELHEEKLNKILRNVKAEFQDSVQQDDNFLSVQQQVKDKMNALDQQIQRFQDLQQRLQEHKARTVQLPDTRQQQLVESINAKLGSQAERLASFEAALPAMEAAIQAMSEHKAAKMSDCKIHKCMNKKIAQLMQDNKIKA